MAVAPRNSHQFLMTHGRGPSSRYYIDFPSPHPTLLAYLPLHHLPGRSPLLLHWLAIPARGPRGHEHPCAILRHRLDGDVFQCLRFRRVLRSGQGEADVIVLPYYMPSAGPAAFSEHNMTQQRRAS